MRPDYITDNNLPNLSALMDEGVWFPQAEVGYMASITVVSHNAIASGLFPGHQGWSDEIYRDVGNRLGGGEGAYYVMSSASCSDFKLLTTKPNGDESYPKLETYLGTLDGGDAKFASIAQKDRSACGVGQPADSTDFIAGMGRTSSSSLLTCVPNTPAQRYRFPAGANVPAYLTLPSCNQFYAQTAPDYQTNTTRPAWLYPLDGNRYVPGFDAGHEGGDLWSANVAIETMRRDFYGAPCATPLDSASSDCDPDAKDWTGMFVGLAGPDKMAHMWGPDDPVTGSPGSVAEQIHLPGELKTVDAQVGRILAELDAEGLRDETLIVVTADHGMTNADTFYGVDRGPQGGVNGGDLNWYYGAETGTKADESYLSPSPAIAALADRIGPNLDWSYQDTHVAVWLKNASTSNRKAAAKAMRTLPSAIATYYVNDARTKYTQDWVSGSAMTKAEKNWFKANAQRLVNTMASSNGPEAVALLKDRTTYSVQGDHGGHQADVQRIPIIFAGPGVPQGAVSGARIRNVDILPTILAILGIQPTAPMDGVAVPMP